MPKDNSEIRLQIQNKYLPVPHIRCCQQSQTSQVMACCLPRTSSLHAMHKTDSSDMITDLFKYKAILKIRLVFQNWK